MPKSVRWSTITVYEFGVALGGSAVPKHGGPAIGLARTPQCVWKTTVEAVTGVFCGCVSDDSGSEDDEQRRVCAACGGPKRSQSVSESQLPMPTRRGRRVRWFKPLERVSLLEKAGYSEKKIYRMLMESSHIAMSRRLSLRASHTKRAHWKTKKKEGGEGV